MESPDRSLLGAHRRGKDPVAKQSFQCTDDAEWGVFEALAIRTYTSTPGNQSSPNIRCFSLCSGQAKYKAFHPLHFALDYNVRHYSCAGGDCGAVGGEVGGC